jgi:copper chaperone
MITLDVEGMTCQGCVNSVKAAVARVDPAARVTVDLAAGRVAIEATTPPAAFERAIEAAGYDVRR